MAETWWNTRDPARWRSAYTLIVDGANCAELSAGLPAIEVILGASGIAS